MIQVAGALSPLCVLEEGHADFGHGDDLLIFRRQAETVIAEPFGDGATVVFVGLVAGQGPNATRCPLSLT